MARKTEIVCDTCSLYNDPNGPPRANTLIVTHNSMRYETNQAGWVIRPSGEYTFEWVCPRCQEQEKQSEQKRSGDSG